MDEKLIGHVVELKERKKVKVEITEETNKMQKKEEKMKDGRQTDE